MANRTTIMGGIWADGAPDPPSGSTPAADTTYANSLIETSAITAGWPHLAVVDSADHNEIMRRVTTLLGLIESNGVLPWCATTTYSANARAMGSNQVVYQSKAGSNLNHDPTSSSAYWAARNGNLIGVQTFSTAGTHTYTPTDGTAKVLVEVQAAGGAGSGSAACTASQVAAGSGGGAGGYALSLITSAFSGVTVTVGAGGTPASGAGGGSGGSSSFGSLLSATGGGGGITSGAASFAYTTFYGLGTPGTGTGGNLLNASGGIGRYCIYVLNTNVIGGDGGASRYGSGGIGQGSVLQTGINAVSPGAGGGGSLTYQSGSAASGGSGADGIVIVWEYA